jgi:hypothetical protein
MVTKFNNIELSLPTNEAYTTSQRHVSDFEFVSTTNDKATFALVSAGLPPRLFISHQRPASYKSLKQTTINVESDINSAHIVVKKALSIRNKNQHQSNMMLHN